MALVRCPECKKEISDSADSCPHCGYKLKNPTYRTEEKVVVVNNGGTNNSGLVVAGIILLFICPIVGIILIIVGAAGNKGSKAKKEKKKERSDMEKQLIKQAKIDALASIDPTNTAKSREQLDIVNKLDDLD